MDFGIWQAGWAASASIKQGKGRTELVDRQGQTGRKDIFLLHCCIVDRLFGQTCAFCALLTICVCVAGAEQKKDARNSILYIGVSG